MKEGVKTFRLASGSRGLCHLRLEGRSLRLGYAGALHPCRYAI